MEKNCRHEIWKNRLPFHTMPWLNEELVVQNSCREPHSSVTIRRFRKRKSCCHVIAIPQAGIAALTLTVMQGFKANKKLLRAYPFPLRIVPFQAIAAQARIKPGCGGWKLSMITTTLRILQQCNDKMSDLNQCMRKRQWHLREFCMTSFYSWSTKLTLCINLPPMVLSFLTLAWSLVSLQ